MDKKEIFDFIQEQKTAFIASIDEQGFPVMRAMLAPRKIDGNFIYFSTNTSSCSPGSAGLPTSSVVYLPYTVLA